MRVSPAPDGKVFVAIRDQSELLSRADAETIAAAIQDILDRSVGGEVVSRKRYDELITTALERT